MNRTFVAMYQNNDQHYTLGYDYHTNEYFKIKGRNQSNATTVFSAFTGIVLYALFKDLEFNFGVMHPLIIVLISITLGCITGMLGIIWMWKAVNRNIKKDKIVVSLTNDEIVSAIQRGRKELRTVRYLLIFLVPFTILMSITMLFIPNQVLLFTINSLLYGGAIFFIWAVRPIKRKKIYNAFIDEVIK